MHRTAGTPTLEQCWGRAACLQGGATCLDDERVGPFKQPASTATAECVDEPPTVGGAH